MSIVTLVSGGLDSTLVARLAQEEGIRQFPLFVDYGQRARARELASCQKAMRQMGLPEPEVANLSGFGSLIKSGLTSKKLRVVEDAFTPGRNMLFLLVAAAHAYQVGADAISIGLLHESTSLFPDQTGGFIQDAQRIIDRSMGRQIRVLTPLADFRKAEVIALAKAKGLRGTYSCHKGAAKPCGRCIACKEFRS